MPVPAASRVALLAVLLGLLAGCLPLTGSALFRPLKEPSAAMAEAQAADGSQVLRRRLAAIDTLYLESTVLPAAADPFRPPTMVRLNLFGDVRTDAALSVRGDTDPQGARVLSGPLLGIDDSLVTLVLENGMVAGTVWIGRRLFRIRPLSKDRCLIEEVNTSLLPVRW